MPNVLIIDDEADIRELVSDILKDEGYTTKVAANAKEAIGQMEALHSLSAVILDIWLEGSEMDGIGILKKIKALHPTLPVIMISGHGNIETAVQTIRLGAYDFIEKPFKAEKLLILLERAISSYTLIKQNDELKKANDINSEYIGVSKQSLAILNTVKTIANTNSRVLISGPHGVGKEALARYIHKKSTRADKPFFTINAANISEDKFDEELFGLDSRNGAHKEGVLDKANEGTLYIDEISEMPTKVQAKFLKVLQESGGAKKYDIRIITGTSKNLLSEIENGKLNQSLYYRINVVPIEISPLVQRKDDIRVLIEYFIEHFAKILSVKKVSLTKQALGTLEIYNWPGNVRQLKNTVEWLMIMYGKQKLSIDTEDLPIEFMLDYKKPKGGKVTLDPDIISKPLKEAREDFEKEYLTLQLDRFLGNIAKTAEFVGMERTALYRKLKLLKIC